ncbi:hypothetical protein I6F14_23695 [Bradyrhizobium sp. IC3069]|uniref:hypothetical protein n=1 Tax=unclassified Bradyrhizobium TaxID=2631580 RepID=UPI001CD3AF72|nr:MULTISPECIES: hypothetical protein [unclassified Bradyrhizobium]MCA1363409.1 hypothetical protein [Bradyrhizobium sp. IC4059]MCA1520947.1 hypothetical protein [Bradyrhizobium sp. IC3069]
MSDESSPPANSNPSGKLTPSGFMRKLRPEYYSDTEDRASYVLDKPALEYHLDTITKRNQTHDFEIFCRKLCERTICPHLRPQTGPEGGGDSKADTETYPVTKGVAALTYVGQPREGSERWAFAFSAKERWAQKVRSDVEGLVKTGRGYDRIICITSRFAKAKDRARLEDELTKQYSIPVTIHDRSWIVTEIIEKDRKDLAFNYLGIGQQKDDPLRLGPTDYSRARQLAETEKLLDDPEAFEGMERQRVTEALIAAKLSRNLERPRTETDGRFLRAIRLAEADGSYRQKLEAKYEQIWTAFWWFDDVGLVNGAYTEFEKLALCATHSKNLEFLCNLNQLLVNSIGYNHLSRQECKYDERTARLRQALEPIAADRNQPNNRLEAVTSLLILRLNDALLEQQPERFSGVWRDYASVLDEARGLGEFDAGRLERMIELGGNIAGNDPAYTSLIEKLAAFVSERTGEAEGALILLKRAQKLDLSDNLEMIRLLGKAAIGLTKKEYAESLTDAVQRLMLAYRSAGLLWAARSSGIFAAATLAIEGEENSQPPVGIIPTLKIWAWIALAMRHMPDLLHAIQVLNGAREVLPLEEESKAKVKEDLCELDVALGSILLNLGENDVRKLSSLPDVLEGLGLFTARTALLYALGYEDLLRADGSLPQSESDEDVSRFLSILASQPIAEQTRGPLILSIEGERQTFETRILGMTIDIEFDGTDQLINVAAIVLGSLEAFFSTSLEQRIMPHAERFQIKLKAGAGLSEPQFEIDNIDMSGEIVWPIGLPPANFDRHADIQQFLALVSGQVLVTTCMFDNPKKLLDEIFEDEAVQQRMALIAASTNSYRRLMSQDVARLSDWNEFVHKNYELRPKRPVLQRLEFETKPSAAGEEEDSSKEPKSHRNRTIRSVIDLHAWNSARWKGVAFADLGPVRAPAMAFMFENREAATKIFERWRARFGERDVEEEIYLTIIRQLPEQSPNHYLVFIASKQPDLSAYQSGQGLAIASRSMTMEPNDSVNIDRFLTGYHRCGTYVLMPAILQAGQPPELLLKLGIIKRAINVKLAAHINPEDIESLALRQRGMMEPLEQDSDFDA